MLASLEHLAILSTLLHSCTRAASTITTIGFTNTAIDYTKDKDWDFASDQLSRFASKNGAAIEFTFEGNHIQIFGGQNGQGAEFRVIIDDSDAQTGTSFRAASKVKGQLVFDSGNLGDTDEKHFLRLEHTDEDGKAVDFESFRVTQLIQESYFDDLKYSQQYHSSKHDKHTSTSLPATTSNKGSVIGSEASVSSTSDGSSTAGSFSILTASLSIDAPSTLLSTTSGSDTSVLANSLSSTANTALTIPATTSAQSAQDIAAKASSASADEIHGSTRPPLGLILPLAIGLPLSLLAAALAAGRFLYRRKRQVRLTRFERVKVAGMDFECIGEDGT